MGTQEMMRGSGILLAVSSLPSPFGIGTLGDAAFRFVDLLVDLKQKYWQVLPLGPTVIGDQVYKAQSAFAGNPFLIDLEELATEGLLTTEEIGSYRWSHDESKIDYAALEENRLRILRSAYERFDVNDPKFVAFCEQNHEWLDTYSLFMTLKEQYKSRQWQAWPEEFRKKQPVALANYRTAMYNSIRFWGFCQYQFYAQWAKLRAYANFRGIMLIGDMSFYMGEDSVDIWAHSEQFMLDETGYPSCVVTTMPNRTSEDRNKLTYPLYDWKAMEEDGFTWWRRRMEHCASMYDIVHMDHFSSLVKSYTVLRGQPDASGGRWIKGPGKKLLDVLNVAVGGRCVIADESEGRTVIPGAKKLFDKSGWFGTRALMYAFDGDTANEHLPHNYADCREAVYAGSHDSDTIVGHFRDRTEYELAYLYEYLNIDSQEEIPDALIRCAYASTADIVIIQMQDLLGLGNEARSLSGVDGQSWRWRMNREQLDDRRRAWIRNLAAVYRR